MSYLSAEEALRVSDAFIITMYGHDLFHRWRSLKKRLQFTSETDFMLWVVSCMEAHCDAAAQVDVEVADDGDGGGVESSTDLTGLSLENEVEHECTECGVTFLTDFMLHQHIEEVHSLEEHACPHCHQSFKHVDQMMRHVTRVHGMDELGQDDVLCVENREETSRPHTCHICGKCYLLSRSLRRHVNDVHCKEAIHSCGYCDFKSGSKIALRRHMQQDHGQPFARKPARPSAIPADVEQPLCRKRGRPRKVRRDTTQMVDKHAVLCLERIDGEKPTETAFQDKESLSQFFTVTTVDVPGDEVGDGQVSPPLPSVPSGREGAGRSTVDPGTPTSTLFDMMASSLSSNAWTPAADGGGEETSQVNTYVNFITSTSDKL